MADHEIVITKLTVNLERGGPDGDKTMKPVIECTEGGETYRIELPAMPCLELCELVRQFNYALTLEKREADLVVSENLSMPLDRKPKPD